jgi:membrane associated rhomboid family serine protease
VRRGQLWRLGTFLFIPPASQSYWILITLYFTWWIGSSLEQHWGPFRFNVYYLFGALATIVAGAFASPISNAWLNDSLILAFATVFPNVEIFLFFLVPVRVKWIGVLVACVFAYELALGDFATRAAIAAALANYVLFFAEDGWRALRGQRILVRQQVRRAEARQTAPPLGQRQCAMCGVREADGADIRVCACAKCGGRPRNLCLEHARNH